MEDSSESYEPSKESCRRSANVRNRRYREKLKASGQQSGPKGALLAAEEEKRALLAERLALDQQFAGMCSLERHQQEMQATLATAGLAEEPAEGAWWWRLPQALLGGRRPQPAAPAALPPTESSGAAYIDPSATQPPSGAGFVVWFKRHFKQAFINLLLRGVVTPSDAEFREYFMTCADDDLAWRVENHRSAAISLLTQVEAGAISWQAVEGSFSRVVQFRVRFLRSLLAHRPDLMLRLIISKLTPPPDAGAAGESSRLARLLHPSLHFVADLGWTDAQRAVLRPHWELCEARVASIRSQAAEHLEKVRLDAYGSVSAWESSIPSTGSRAAGLYDSLAGSTGGLDTWTRLELVASIDLMIAVQETVTPMQGLKLWVHSQPYFADGLQICRWLFL